MIGKQILNYRIEKLLGEGGMGNVYLGIHNHLDRKVAIKMLHPLLAHNPEIRERFKKEAATLSQFHHPNIVTLYDYVEQDNEAYLIMEYVDGKPLDDYINTVSGPIPEERAIGLFNQILDGVSYAHKKGVIHRDIKPSNFIITSNDEIKILDFGIAKILGDTNLKLTKTGMKIGTILYMSPEQVKGEPLDIRTDIYSLGITLFQMVTGRCPYDDTTSEYAAFKKIVEEPLPDAKAIYPATSDNIKNIILQATAKELRNRFQNCDAFKSALNSKHVQPIIQTEYAKTVISAPIPFPVEIKQEQIPVIKKKNFLWLWLLLSFIGIIVIAVLIITNSSVSSSDGNDKDIEKALTDSIRQADSLRAIVESTVADIDGNVYKTVKIGNQIWMTENLKVTHYRNGDAIPNIISNYAWCSQTTGAYCDYENDAANANTYGRLYNWYAVSDVRKIAPSGWHIPSNSEWSVLIAFLGGENIAGGKMKEKGTANWDSPNTGATNESGFTALPGKERSGSGLGNFSDLCSASYWSSSAKDAISAGSCDLQYNFANAWLNDGAYKKRGFSLRCVKD